MMLKFKHIETREAIQNKLMQKFDVILDQYTREILNVDDNFTVCIESEEKLPQIA